MPKYQHLPTFVSGDWSVTSFRDSFIRTLESDYFCDTLCMYFYAVTKSGWDHVREPVLQWKNAYDGRTVTLFVGTDHGITDPSALQEISDGGLDVRLMREYSGVFHPKVVWLKGDKRNTVLVGSNNLTRDGLLNNIEFALLVKSRKVPSELDSWAKMIGKGSVELTPKLLNSYDKQRREFEKFRAQSRFTTFTWREKINPVLKKPRATTKAGNLIIEVMPKETGGQGRQLQLPVRAASTFFGVKEVGSTKRIDLRTKQGKNFKGLTLSMFKNRTVRIMISDLEYRDRPCILVFCKISNVKFEYEIVSENIHPSRYRDLLLLCTEKTRYGSRRWGFT